MTSIAWMVYAMLLLVSGMARKVTGLRWASLAFFSLAIGKVFVYDWAGSRTSVGWPRWRVWR